MARVIPALLSLLLLLVACATYVVPPRPITVNNAPGAGRPEGGGKDQPRRPGDDLDELRRRNRELQQQLDALTRERDTLKRQQERGPYLVVPGGPFGEGQERQSRSHPFASKPPAPPGGFAGEGNKDPHPPSSLPTSLPPPAKAEVEQAMRQWKLAWERSLYGQYEDYFRWYVPQGFVQWEDGSRRDFPEFRRHKRGLTPKRHIAVELRDLQIAIQDGKAIATFYQIYDSNSTSGDRYRDEGRKTLHWVQTPEGPRIIFERWESGRGSPG